MASDEALLARLDRLIGILERQLPGRTDPDWSVIAWRWRNGLVEVRHPNLQDPDDLLGIERQKAELTENTHRFVSGLPANNALLWGSRGTGKSSLIRAMLQQFSGQGLRLIEVDKADLVDLPDIVEPLFGRDEKFIIYCDDLSFEADDARYTALKAVLDGSIAATPDNVLIYATSNRRHLLPEYLDENQQAQNIDGEIHHGDAVEERISLSERFGLWLAFHPFSQAQYLQVVAASLQQSSLDDETRAAALRYALSRGSRSGRVAAQFARSRADAA